jgi:uncharacterized surface protein with fasciclin (FAS1) repeats/putative cell wall-binding protein
MSVMAIPGNSELSIAANLAADDESRFETLLAAAGIAGLDEALADPDFGPVTLFAPTDDAFAALEAALGEEAWDALLADPDMLADVLLYHLLDGEVYAADLPAPGESIMVETLNGQDIEIEVIAGEPNQVHINGVAFVIETDYEASNGVIHVIDAVLVPEFEEPCQTIAEIAAADGRFDTLLAAAGIAGLDEALADPDFGPVTLFAPTDDAFAALEAALGEEAWDALLADPDMLADVLLYHLLDGEVYAADVLDLASEGPVSVPTLLGQDIEIELLENGEVEVWINGVALVFEFDIQACNGVIHVIDAVLVPEFEEPCQTIAEIAAADGRFDTLLAAAGIAGLDEALADPDFGPVTLFAPTDDAFAALEAALGEEAWDALLADPDMLADVLLYHLLDGEVYAADVLDLASEGPVSVPTLLGQDIEIELLENGEVEVWINGVALVFEFDIQACNGVIHVIDAVLVPEFEEPCQTIAEIAAADGRFDTLLAAAGIAGLDEALADPDFGPVTLFAPTDDAFAALEAALGEEAWDALLADPDMLADVLLYHLLDGEVYAADVLDLASEGPVSVPTLLGQDIEIELLENGEVEVWINGVALVFEFDIQACNGVIHVIDAVLVPEFEEPCQTIAEIAAADGRFDTLLAAAGIAGLDEALADPDFGPVTLFAPTDDAFAALEAALGEEAWDALLADPDMLADVLLYHLLDGEVYAADVLDLASEGPVSVPTLLGQDIEIELLENGEVEVWINGVALVFEFDIQACNGVIHVIDAVLVPEFEEPLPPVIEVEGINRFLTAVAASELAFPDGSEYVVIASGRNWPDALAGTSLAAALDAPILLVEPGSVPVATADEIERLGATNIIILGGVGAVEASVQQVFESLDYEVERIGGLTRYETADMIAMRVFGILGEDYDGMALVATGGDFPDAIAAAPLASGKIWPLFLAHPTSGLSVATKAVMAANGVEEAVILGGTGAVSSAVQADLVILLGSTDDVTRLGGLTRYDTAVEIAEYAVHKQGFMWNRVGITTGQDFPDALAGGVLQGKVGSVMLLTTPTSLHPSTAAALTMHKDEITTVTYFGGTGAVSQAVRNAIALILQF